MFGLGWYETFQCISFFERRKWPKCGPQKYRLALFLAFYTVLSRTRFQIKADVCYLSPVGGSRGDATPLVSKISKLNLSN